LSGGGLGLGAAAEQTFQQHGSEGKVAAR
jgi:hypothetical protein